MCGGTAAGAYLDEVTLGLSPRVRGNPPGALRANCAAGSIPACAGEPQDDLRPAVCPTVYPRVCGGTGSLVLSAMRTAGLSPRVRGNLVIVVRSGVGVRSIPACAGEPRVLAHYRKNHQVYPRVCGGTPVASSAVVRVAGLSPRVRGNRSSSPARRRRPGSIPACAGEPRTGMAGMPAHRVYPRVCGGTLRIS